MFWRQFAVLLLTDILQAMRPFMLALGMTEFLVEDDGR
jgi:hypothetical protein